MRLKFVDRTYFRPFGFPRCDMSVLHGPLEQRRLHVVENILAHAVFFPVQVGFEVGALRLHIVSNMCIRVRIEGPALGSGAYELDKCRLRNEFSQLLRKMGYHLPMIFQNVSVSCAERTAACKPLGWSPTKTTQLPPD